MHTDLSLIDEIIVSAPAPLGANPSQTLPPLPSKITAREQGFKVRMDFLFIKWDLLIKARKNSLFLLRPPSIGVKFPFK